MIKYHKGEIYTCEYTQQNVIMIVSLNYLQNHQKAQNGHKLNFHLTEFVFFNTKDLLYLQ